MKYILTTIVLLFFFLLGASQAQAAPTEASWKWQTQKQFFDAIDPSTTDTNLESTWFVGTLSSVNSHNCILGGLCTDDPTKLNGYIRQSPIGQLANIVDSTYVNQPADFGLWLADTGHTLGFLPKPAYAQGIGFSGLLPLLPIWKAFRNIAYFLMAIVMITIGFLIMFRKKIDPKTVVTAQNAIPRVIIALILITFSYAIVGFMIDLMYVVLFFFIVLFKSTGYLPGPDPATLTGMVGAFSSAEALYSQGNLGWIFGNVLWDPYKILFGINFGEGAWMASLGSAAVAIITGVFGSTIPLTWGITIGAAIMPVFHLILTIAMLYLFIRLVIFFITSYIQIILSLLMAPIQLLFEALPGSNAFSSWFKNLVANLAVFPLGGAMFMLSSIFAQFANQGPVYSPDLSNIETLNPFTTRDTTAIWLPPYTGFWANNMTSVASIISLGILFAIPQVAGSIKEALKAKPALSMPDVGGAGGGIMNFLSTAYYFKMLAPSGLMEKLTGGGGKKDAH
jgi:hypothetical protein